MRILVCAFLLASLALAAAPEIRIDQVGYLPGAPKLALVAADAETFQLKRASDNATVFQGKLGATQLDADSGDTLRLADFSGFRKSGDYYLDVPGVGRSWPFAIRAGLLDRVYYLAMRAFYGQRCGTKVDLGPKFPGYSYPACHLDGRYHASSGKPGPVNNPGGWHDAGDYGRYIVNSGISTSSLMWAWELYPARLKKISLDIPESGRVTPDFLAEVRWNLDWMLSMQDEDGGVWHKQTSASFPGFIMPDEDRQPSEIIGTGAEPYKNTCATADLAAVAAQASRLYKPYDAAFAARALAAARRAWAWTERYPNVTFTRNPAGVRTGGYTDSHCGDELLWAAAELYRATGEAAYNRYFLANYARYRDNILNLNVEGWKDMAPLAWWAYSYTNAKDGAEARAAIRQTTLEAARGLVERSRRNPYRVTLAAKEYVWGSNGVVACQAMLLLIARTMHPKEPGLAEAALDDLHYLLGRNTFSLSWVTQVGANPYRNPHHRPSGGDKNKEPWPGLLSGGPNARRQDPVLQKLGAGLPPARYYADDQGSFGSNEVAINWQAALVFTLAGLLD